MERLLLEWQITSQAEENILLFVQRGTSCYEMSGTQTEPMVLNLIFVTWGQISPKGDFSWCFFADLLWTLEVWGVPFLWGVLWHRVGDLIKLCHLEERVVSERCDRGGNGHPGWAPEVPCADGGRFQKVSCHCYVPPIWALKTGGSNCCKNALPE